MSFVVTPASEADVNAEWVDLLFDTFGGQSALNDAIHPENMTPAGRKRGLKFYKNQFKRPEARFVKVTKDKELVGVADYEAINLGGQKFSDDPKPLVAPEDNWDSEKDAGWAHAMFADIRKQRNRMLADKPHYVVSLVRMAVKKEYQRQGVGKLLMKFGTDLADSLSAEMTVEASPSGKLLYQQFGYVDPHPSAIILEVPEAYADRPKQPLFFLHRPATSN